MVRRCPDIEDTPALLGYLRLRGAIEPQEQAHCQRLEGGVSNRVVLVTPERSRPFVMKQALEKLRVQVDWFCTPERVKHEALALENLRAFAPPGAIPELFFCDGESHLLAMEAVPEPHQNWKKMLLCGEVVRDHVAQFGNLLGILHRESAKHKDQALNWFPDRAVYEVLRLEPYYRYTAEQVPEAAEFLQQLIEDTLAQRLTVVHGDYSPKNILVHHNRLVLLDYEVVHCGDPAFDVGFGMAHFLSKANHLPSYRDRFVAAAFDYWRSYQSCVREEPWARGLEARAVRHTLACCLARVKGRSPLEYLTTEERAAQMAIAVRLMRKTPETMEDCVRDYLGVGLKSDPAS